MKIIDSHQHVFWHGRNDAGLVQDMDEHGIELAWLLSWEIAPWEDQRMYHKLLNPRHMRSNGTHPGIILDDLLRCRDRYPDRFVLGYCPHPLIGDAPGLFEAACDMHGVQVLAEWKFNMPIDDPRCIELFRAGGRRKAPVVLHLDAPWLMNNEGKLVYQQEWYGGTPDDLERALQACPETNFIGHAPGFWRYISGDAERDPGFYPRGPVVPGGRIHQLLERNANLYADLSAGSGLRAMNRDPEHARQFLIRFADRLLFARDYYGQDLHRFLQTLDLPQEVREKIYFRNAERLLPPKAPQRAPYSLA